MKNSFRVDKKKMVEIFKPIPTSKKPIFIGKSGDMKYMMREYDLIDIKTARTIFADLDKIILSGYPYKRFHPRKYNMLKKKYL